MARRVGPALSCLASALMAAGTFAPVDGHALTWALPASLQALSVQDDDAEDADWQDESGESEGEFEENESAGEEEQAADTTEAEDASWEDEPADESAEESESESEESDANAEDPAAESVDESSAPEEEEAEDPEAATPDEAADPASPPPEPLSPQPPPPPPPPDPPAPPTPVTAGRVASRSWDDPDDKTIYRVVISHDEQYSIWPADREPPFGWRDAGKTGSKQEVLDYIQEVWTDTRPSSLRKKMEEAERERQKDGGQ